jgi:two-component system, OmpR family, response regulator YxdJ
LYEELLKDHSPHAILLDVHMPILDGHQLYKMITAHPRYNGCPISFISGDISDETKVRSYQSGGVDFLSRDVRSGELVLRLINKIKLYQQHSTKLDLGNLRLDVEALELTIGHEVQTITMLEMRILGILLRSYPEVLSRVAVIHLIWGNEPVKPGTINTHITNLKPKIEKWDHCIRVRDDQVLIQKKEF